MLGNHMWLVAVILHGVALHYFWAFKLCSIALSILELASQCSECYSMYFWVRHSWGWQTPSQSFWDSSCLKFLHFQQVAAKPLWEAGREVPMEGHRGEGVRGLGLQATRHARSIIGCEHHAVLPSFFIIASIFTSSIFVRFQKMW